MHFLRPKAFSVSHRAILHDWDESQSSQQLKSSLAKVVTGIRQRQANNFYAEPHLKLYCYRWPHVYYVYFNTAYNLQRMKHELTIINITMYCPFNLYSRCIMHAHYIL